MPDPATFESFQQELARLVAKFDRDYPQFVAANYNEATLRTDFLDPLFRALGWDVGNTKALIHSEREVDIEVQTGRSGRQTRADYVFRYARVERFTCEAKKPAEALNDRHIFQAKRDAFGRGIPLALLSDFEELKLYVVGAAPHRDDPHTGELNVLHFRQYLDAARELWDLLAYDSVRAGSIDRELAKLPKRPLKLKGRQGYLFRPDRTRAVDADFLSFLDDARQQLGSDLLKHNDREDLLTGHRLNEAAQRILDRLVFLRICEDRGIDTGQLLQTLFESWLRQQDQPPKIRRPGRPSQLRFGGGTDGADALAEEPAAYGSARGRIDGSLYREVTDHIRSLDQRPPSYKPFFNGQLFKPHFSEELVVGDEWLANFLSDLTAEDSKYNFADIKVEILGDAYERFLGKVLRPQGRGATIEEKPEVRKAGGVYYTPRYIVEYIVEQTVGRLLEGKALREVEKLRFVDPACGSGSFLLYVYERVMKHYLLWFIAHPDQRRKTDCYTDAAGNVRLTTALKRRILVANIYGVDIDAQAVEVTQLSLYLKMLEDENRDTLRTQTELFRGEPLLPALDQNIRCFNSLIASDFSLDPAELVRVNAGDWDVQFPAIMKAGGFDAVVGNPPYVLLQSLDDRAGFEYLGSKYRAARYKIDTYQVFVERAVMLLKERGYFGFITPNSFLRNKHALEIRAFLLERTDIDALRVFYYPVFRGASVDTCILTAIRTNKPNPKRPIQVMCSDSENQDRQYSIGRKAWEEHLQKNFTITEGGAASALLSKIQSNSILLGEFATAYFGIQTFDRKKFVSPRKVFKYQRPVVDGQHVHRYGLLAGGEFVDFRKEAIKSGGNPAVYSNDRIVVRQIGRAPIAAWIPAEIYTLNTIYNVFLTRLAPISLKAVLGLMLSQTLQWFWIQQFFDQKETFPKIKKDALLSLPIPKLDLTIPTHKTQHDRLVSLVDKMLLLTPALRLAKTDAERRAVENALAKPDRDIDQLVYQL